MRVGRSWAACVLVLGVAGLGSPAATADAPTAVTLVAERSGAANIVREQGVGGASLTVARGTASFDGASISTLTFNSTVDNQIGTLQTVVVSADLAPGTYTTSRLPGQAEAMLDPGSISQCGGTETGTLTISEASYTPEGVPSTFAGSFDTDACDDNGPVHGEIRWSSSVTVSVATGPTAVSIDQPVAANASADVDVAFTAYGNAAVTFGTARVHEQPQWDGTTHWSIADDKCAGAVVLVGQSCAVTLRFSAGYPNGVPSGSLPATVTIADGQIAPISVEVAATIAALPGQPRGLRIDGAFRHLVLYWGAPSSWPTGWTRFGPTTWNIYRQVGGVKRLVGSTVGTAVGPTSFVLPELSPKYSGTFSVQGVQAGVPGATSAPIAGRVADRELLYAEDYAALQNQQLTPAAGVQYAYQGLADQDMMNPHDLAISANQTVMAWDVRDDGDPQSSTIGVGPLNGSRATFPDVSGGDGSGVHWDVDPALSPDGGLIAYSHSSSDSESDAVLRVASLRTGGTVRAVPNSSGLTDPTFTPDGTALVAVKHDGATTSLVQIAIASGVRSELPGTEGLIEPAESTDGRLAAVRRLDDGSSELVVIPNGGAVHPVDLSNVPYGLNWHPSWTRDGLVAFVHRDDLAPADDEVFGNAVIVNPDTGTVSALTDIDGGGVQAPQVLVDDQPDVTAPTPALSVSDPRGRLGTTAKIKWSAKDPTVALAATSGVASFDIRYRSATANRAWSRYHSPVAWQQTTSTHASMPMAAGTQYCISVRARDQSGNTSAWTANTCVGRAADDRALNGPAERRANSHYYEHTYTRVAGSRSMVQLANVTTRHVALVVTTCRSCGTIDVYLAHRYLGRISTHAAATHYQQIRWLHPTNDHTGTLKLKPISSSPTYIDGLITTR